MSVHVRPALRDRCHCGRGAGSPEAAAVNPATRPADTTTLRGWTTTVGRRGPRDRTTASGAGRTSISGAAAASGVGRRPERRERARSGANAQHQRRYRQQRNQRAGRPQRGSGAARREPPRRRSDWGALWLTHAHRRRAHGPLGARAGLDEHPRPRSTRCSAALAGHAATRCQAPVWIRGPRRALTVKL